MLSTFRTAREAYLADLRISKSQKTYEQYELVLRKFGEWLEQTAAEQMQEQITPLTITAWKQAVAERGVKQNTIIHYLMILKSFFRWAIANRFYSEQPVEDEVFPQEEEIKHDIPTLDEIQLLLSGKIPPRTPHALRNLAIVTLFIESGMRVSELCALTVGNVDFENCMIAIQNGKGSKARFVPLLPRSTRRIQAYLDEREKTYGKSAIAPSMPLFCGNTEELQPLNRNTVSEVVKGYVERLTGHKGIGAHDLRHAAASWWDRQNIPIRTVQKALGHSSVQTTERVYVQILDKKQAARDIVAAFAGMEA